MAALEGGEIREFTLHPEDAGLPVYPFEAIMGGTPAENAAAFRALLDGAAGGLPRCGAVERRSRTVVADKAATLKEGVEIARDSIDSGAARAKIAALRHLTHA